MFATKWMLAASAWRATERTDTPCLKIEYGLSLANRLSIFCANDTNSKRPHKNIDEHWTTINSVLISAADNHTPQQDIARPGWLRKRDDKSMIVRRCVLCWWLRAEVTTTQYTLWQKEFIYWFCDRAKTAANRNNFRNVYRIRERPLLKGQMWRICLYSSDMLDRYCGFSLELMMLQCRKGNSIKSKSLQT